MNNLPSLSLASVLCHRARHANWFSAKCPPRQFTSLYLTYLLDVLDILFAMTVHVVRSVSL